MHLKASKPNGYITHPLLEFSAETLGLERPDVYKTTKLSQNPPKSDSFEAGVRHESIKNTHSKAIKMQKSGKIQSPKRKGVFMLTGDQKSKTHRGKITSTH